MNNVEFPVSDRYGIKFMDDYQAIMTKKLGLPKYNKQLISDLLKNMAVDKVDYTNFFRLLSNIKADPTIPEQKLLIPLKAVLLDIGKERKEAWTSWVQSYIQEVSANVEIDIIFIHSGLAGQQGETLCRCFLMNDSKEYKAFGHLLLGFKMN